LDNRKLPLPSREREGVRGSKEGVLKSRRIITRTVPLSIKAEEKDRGLRMEKDESIL
jgi:hypothetical protein